MKKYIKYTIIAVIAILIITALVILNINKRNQENKNDDKLKIVTSFYPMYIIAENLVEDTIDVELVNMADINVGCLHDYTLTTEDMKKLENADIFIENGLGMESFLSKIINSNEDMYILDSSANIQDLIQINNEINPHIWTSLDNYIWQVKNISEGLQKQDSKNAQIYKKNEKEYIEKLEDLKEKYSEDLKGLEGESAIILNEAFEYLGQELKLNITTIEVEHGESTLSADKLKNIINKVKKENIKKIIIDKNDNKSNAETIAKETGAKIYELDSGLTGNLDKNAYLNAMEQNFIRFKTCP